MNFTPRLHNLLKEVESFEKDFGTEAAQAYFYEACIALGQEERLDNFYRCKDKQTKREVWFRMNGQQRQYYRNMTSRDMILKPRQIGFTELTIKIGVDNCIFNPGSAEGLMAHKKEKAVLELFQRVRDTFEWFMKDWGGLIPITTNKDAANKIQVETAGLKRVERVDGERVYISFVPNIVKTSYEVSHDFRGGSLTRLHCSEASRIDPARLMGSQDAVPQNGQITHETTANGRGGTFYENWQETKKAKRRKDVYVWEGHFFSWFDHYPEDGHTLVVPENVTWNEEELALKAKGASDISLMWRRWKIRENFLQIPEAFDEEYPSDDETCFLGGESLVSRKYQMLLSKWVCDPIKTGDIFPKNRWIEFFEDPRGYISLWEMPVVGEQYVIGADPAEGVGKDWSVAYIKRRSNGYYVGRIRGQLSPEAFAGKLHMIAMYFNNAYINFERNNHGHVVKDRLVNIFKYYNLYRSRSVDEMVDTWRDDIGFNNRGGERDRIVYQFVARLREMKLHPMDNDLLNEISTFQKNDRGRYEAISGAHDDCVLAAMLTEEMDVALGPYQVGIIDNAPEVEVDPITGYPL